MDWTQRSYTGSPFPQCCTQNAKINISIIIRDFKCRFTQFIQVPLGEERQALRLAGLRRPHLAAAGEGNAGHHLAQGRGHRWGSNFRIPQDLLLVFWGMAEHESKFFSSILCFLAQATHSYFFISKFLGTESKCRRFCFLFSFFSAWKNKGIMRLFSTFVSHSIKILLWGNWKTNLFFPWFFVELAYFA